MYSVERFSIQLSVLLSHWIARADKLAGLALTIIDNNYESKNKNPNICSYRSFFSTSAT